MIKKNTKQVKKFLDFELTAVKLSKKDANGGFIIEGYANTTSKDRVGDVVLSSAFVKSLPIYLTNPIILANHDWSDPCGVCVTAEVVEDKGLFIRAKISDTRFDIQQLIREGCLRTFSIGYNEVIADFDEATKTKYIKELELLEISIVTVPANAEAIFRHSPSEAEQETAAEPTPMPVQKKPEGKAAKVRTAKELKDFIDAVKHAVDRELTGNEVIAACEYFNQEESEIMTKAELIALLKSFKSPAAAAPAATEAAKADAPAAAAEGAKPDASADVFKEVMAKLDAIAQALAQVLEGQSEKPAETEEKPAKEDGKEDEGKAEDAAATTEKAKCPECEGKGDDCKCEDEKEMTLAEADAELALIDAAIAEIEDTENL